MIAGLEMLWTSTKALRQPLQGLRPGSKQSEAKQKNVNLNVYIASVRSAICSAQQLKAMR